ncbi:metallophosphoesterase [Candidatus Parcubacteria bacterium]|nr:metallophosphoesterase [Candidatus Parcubacteria bacterium]
MTIGIISDTHDRLDTLERAVQTFKQHGVKLVVHCGDWIAPFTVAKIVSLVRDELNCPLKGVFGNNDGDLFYILTQNYAQGWNIEFSDTILELEFDGRKIAVYHGTDQAVTASLIASKRYAAVFTGHTHAPLNEAKDGILHLNPGSTSYLRNGSIIDEATVAVYDTEAHTAQIIALDS